MSTSALIFMVTVFTLVISLTVFCFGRIFRKDQRKDGSGSRTS